MTTGPWNPIGDILDGVANFFSDLLRNVVAALIQGLTEAIKAVGTWFLYLPAPVLQGEGGALAPAERVQAYTSWAIPVVGIIATAFALIVVARRKDADSAIDTVIGLLRVVLVAGAAIPATYLLVKFSDEVSPWLLNNISGGTFEEGLGQLTGLDAAAAAGMSVGVMVLLIPILVVGILGGLLNMFFIMLSYGILPVVVGLLPVAAAYAMTARGRNTFGKLLGLLGALILFKPVAAIIYGVGIASARGITGDVGDAGQVVLQALYGCVVLCAAFIALPALVRLVAPAAAAGMQGAGGGAVLMGAAMVATGAVTGGASAVAGAAARGGGTAAKGAGTSATTGAAPATGAAKEGASSGSGGSTASNSGGDSTAEGSGGQSAGTGAKSADSSGSSGSTGSGDTSGSGSDSADAGARVSGASPAGSPAAAGASSGASDRGSQWAQRWRVEGAQQLRSGMAQADRAVEAGDDR